LSSFYENADPKLRNLILLFPELGSLSHRIIFQEEILVLSLYVLLNPTHRTFPVFAVFACNMAHNVIVVIVMFVALRANKWFFFLDFFVFLVFLDTK
jgi:hypothetical protein